MIKLIGEKLQQYDLDRTIEIIPSKGRTVEMVRFIRGRRPYMLAHREEGGKIIADIPNVLLKAFGNVLCIVDYVDEDGHIVTENGNFHVHKREKPADYQYKETDTLEIGEGGTCGGGDGAPSDWNAQEGEAGYIANKPFGDELGVIVPETKLVFEDFNGMPAATLDIPRRLLVAGNAYDIVFNGINYSCVCVDIEGQFGLGNMTMFGGTGNDEPFVIASTGVTTMIVSLEGLSEATISVSGLIPRKVKPKYIPIETIDLTKFQGEEDIAECGALVDIGIDTEVYEQIKSSLEIGLVKIRLNIKYSGGPTAGQNPGNVVKTRTLFAFCNMSDLDENGDTCMWTCSYYEQFVYICFNLALNTAAIEVKSY